MHFLPILVAFLSTFAIFFFKIIFEGTHVFPVLILLITLSSPVLTPAFFVFYTPPFLIFLFFVIPASPASVSRTL